MAPIKFEEQIKDKLEKRILSPSTKSWSNLSDRLDTDQKKSNKPLYWWLSIAAGLIIMLAVIVQYNGKKEVEQGLPILVNEETTQEALEENPNYEGEKNSLELASEDDTIVIEKYRYDSAPQKPQIINYKKHNEAANSKTRLVRNSENIKNPEAKAIVESNKEVEVINKEQILNKNAVADVLKDMNSKKTTVSEREIDSLLKIASKELLKDQLKKETTKTVDASSLLLEVEEDMGQSFRSKVFDALKDGYETVKTSVAQRNN